MTDNSSSSQASVSDHPYPQAPVLSRDWHLPLVVLGLSLAAVLALYWPTVLSLVMKWYGSVSYQHGFVVIPICGYLVWRKRRLFTSLAPTPTAWGILLLFPLGAVWFVGNLVQVQVVQQLALILLLQAITVTLLGVTVSRALAFPLAYLLFAVPFGEDLIPPLQDYTAWFTVQALQLTGIPVYLEGRHLMIPSGMWHVAESCAGIRYIIPSLALGCLFAGVTYRSWSHRLIFIVAAAVVPVVANGIRAYVIVMLAHLTNNALAVGVDHFIYGGVFFGVVMFFMFTIGLRWREPLQDIPEATERPSAPSSDTSTMTSSLSPTRRLVGIAVTALAIIAIAPISARLLAQPTIPSHDATIVAPTVSLPWISSPIRTAEWTPQLRGTPATLARSFENGARRVHLHLALYRHQRQGTELIHGRNDFIDHENWRLVAEQHHTIRLDGHPTTVHARTLRSARTNELTRLWTWYWVAGEFTTNPYYAKWLQLKGHVWGPSGAAFIGLATDFDELAPTSADRALQDFLNHLEEPLNITIQRSVELSKQ